VETIIAGLWPEGNLITSTPDHPLP
jgi:hypothetical protein